MEVLVSGHARDAKKMSVTGTDHLRDWFSSVATRVKWPPTGACPATNQLWKCKKNLFSYCSDNVIIQSQALNSSGVWSVTGRVCDTQRRSPPLCNSTKNCNLSFFFVQEREQEYEESLAQNAEKIVSNRISPTNTAKGYACSRLFTVPYFFVRLSESSGYR